MNLCMSSSFHFSSFSLYLPRSCHDESGCHSSIWLRDNHANLVLQSYSAPHCLRQQPFRKIVCGMIMSPWQWQRRPGYGSPHRVILIYKA